MSFIHLQTYSEHTQAPINIERLVQRASQLQMPALALTDKNIMYGALDFYLACQKANIKPIIGCQFNLDDSNKNSLILLAENNTGYSNLLSLSTAINQTKGLYLSSRLLSRFKSGLIALYLENQNLSLEDKSGILQEYLALLGKDNLFISLQRYEKKYKSEPLIDLSKKLGINLVATHPVCYIEPSKEMFSTHKAFHAIASNITFKQIDLSDQLYFKTQDEMRDCFQDLPQAIQCSLNIAERCHVNLDMDLQIQKNYFMPKFISEKSSDKLLTELCTQALKQRYSNPDSRVSKRLEYELEVVIKLGYSDYFLVVWDFVKYAKENNIAVGPGRGSAPSSLIAYLLGITRVDPLKYNLLFERFLNPERVTPPDIDIDFDHEKREKVIKYVQQKYGEEYVAQIITFGTFSLRSCTNDLKRLFGTDEEPTLINTIASNLVGLTRHKSIHAAGVIISPVKLIEKIPLTTGNTDLALTQYNMNNLKALGFLKFDFLSLRTLNIIDKTILIINQQVPTLNLSSTKIMASLSDQATYKLLSSGESQNIFQLESPSMRKLLQRFKPKCFEDIIALIALYRPGPLEQIEPFLKARETKQFNYLHDNFKDILEPTYGFILYQEQIINIIARATSNTFGWADLLRRKITKNKVTLDDKQEFIQKSMSNNYSSSESEAIYNSIIQFAGYSFARSHAVAYGMLTYQTAYLKSNYPEQFLEAITPSGNPPIFNSKQKTASIYIRISAEYEQHSQLLKLKQIITKYPGEHTIYLYYAKQNRLIQLETAKLNPSASCINEVEHLLGCPSFFFRSSDCFSSGIRTT